MRLIVSVVSVALLGLSGACTTAPEEFHSHRLVSMGTWVEVAWEGPAKLDEQYPHHAVEAELRVFERQFYPWADGELAALNAAIARGEGFNLSVELERLLVMGMQFHQHSDGNFDPGVGALVAAWGFGADPEQQTGQIDGLRPAASIRWLNIDDHVATSSNPGLILDLGGYAKGYAVDRSLELLTRLGVRNAMVNAGGDLRVIGARQGAPWRVGIQHPREPGTIVGSVWLLPGEGAFTSGDYERAKTGNGVRTHHLIDPHNGAPASHTQSVTVIANNGMLADASATAIFVAGPEDWQTVADSMGINKVLRITGAGDLQLTAAMAKRFETVADLQTVIMPRAIEY
ncbi:MAG: FAD:protein FMN transferase [Gammaproteobacteria bacterium]